MRKKSFVWATPVLFWLLLLTACSPSEPQTSTVAPKSVLAEGGTPVPPTPTETRMLDIPDLGAAPELVNETWLNTDAPVTIASQRGKVILLEFWTFG